MAKKKSNSRSSTERANLGIFSEKSNAQGCCQVNTLNTLQNGSDFEREKSHVEVRKRQTFQSGYEESSLKNWAANFSNRNAMVFKEQDVKFAQKKIQNEQISSGQAPPCLGATYSAKGVKKLEDFRKHDRGSVGRRLHNSYDPNIESRSATQTHKLPRVSAHWSPVYCFEGARPSTAHVVSVCNPPHHRSIVLQFELGGSPENDVDWGDIHCTETSTCKQNADRCPQSHKPQQNHRNDRFSGLSNTCLPFVVAKQNSNSSVSSKSPNQVTNFQNSISSSKASLSQPSSRLCQPKKCVSIKSECSSSRSRDHQKKNQHRPTVRFAENGKIWNLIDDVDQKEFTQQLPNVRPSKAGMLKKQNDHTQDIKGRKWLNTNAPENAHNKISWKRPRIR